MSAQQISASDLLPMDTRPSQCTSRKKLPNALFAVNTQQLCNFASSQAAHDLGQQEHLFKQQSNIGSKSNNEICNRANQLNYNLTNSSLRRCLSSTPVLLSSPEPVSSSGYCSSTTSNSNTAISNQSMTNEHRLASEDRQPNDKRSDQKAKYTIDGYQSSNTSLSSCDKVLIKSSNETTNKTELNKQTTKEQLSKDTCNEKSFSKQHSTAACSISLIKRPKSSIKKPESLIERTSHIPSYSSTQSNHKSQQSAQQSIRTKFRTPIDAKNGRNAYNAFGFLQTPAISSNKVQAVEQTKIRSNSTAGQLSILSKRNLATSLSSLPTTKTPTMLPVLKQTSLRKTNQLISNPTEPASKINRPLSNSTQNVNVQSNFGFSCSLNRARQAGLNNKSKQYNSSTSLNSAPINRTTKNCSKINLVHSIRTRSTNNLDHLSQELIGGRNRYPNYLTSSQHITNQANGSTDQSDLENSTSSKFSNESTSSAPKLRRPSLRTC